MFKNGSPRVKAFYNPPTLLLRQAASALYFSYLVGWKKLFPWLIKGKRTLPTAAGAIGMGCIGFPIHPVWEVTNACNLKCVLCHACSGQAAPDELNTEEGKRLLDGMAGIGEFRMLALGGGEPQIADRRPALRVSDFGIETEVPHQDDLVHSTTCHDVSPSAS